MAPEKRLRRPSCSVSGIFLSVSGPTSTLNASFINATPRSLAVIVYVGSTNSSGHSNVYVYAMNASTGALLWSYHIGVFKVGTPAVGNGVVYVGSDDKHTPEGPSLSAGSGRLRNRAHYTLGEIVMRPSRIPVYILVILELAARVSAQTPAATQRIVIAASTVLDGKGQTLHDVRIVIEGSKIVGINPGTGGPVDYDLRGLTVLPGWIDAHVHITWIFGKDGKNAGTEGTTQEDAYRAASNAWVTLMAGFTTVQSVGAPNDIPLRDAIAKGMLPGPRILTAVEPLEGKGDATGTPDEIRAFIRKQRAAGADLIKIFASESIRLGEE